MDADQEFIRAIVEGVVMGRRPSAVGNDESLNHPARTITIEEGIRQARKIIAADQGYSLVSPMKLTLKPA